MKNRVYGGLLFFIVALSAFSGKTLQASEIQMLRTGSFHGGEVKAKSVGDWFGLFPVGSGFELQRVEVTIEASHDDLLDREGEKTGSSVIIDIPDEPLFLVKGAPGLKEGPVETSFSGDEFLFPGQSKSLNLTNDSFMLHAYGEAIEQDGSLTDTVLRNYRLKLLCNKPGYYSISQQIAVVKRFSDEGTPTLLWAGDIDGDGMLDLLMDMTDHNNVSVYTLFLSRQAKKGDLVRKAAVFRIVGC